MSYCTMYAAPAGGLMVEVRTYPNSWGGAARIWRSICGRYLGNDLAWMTSCDEAAGGLWVLAKPGSPLERWERIVLASTYDRALIEDERFLEMADLYQRFSERYPVAGVDHLPTWAEDLECLANGTRFYLCEPPVAVGWHHSSVAECLWDVPDGEDSSRPYDLSKDDGHWFVWECIDQWQEWQQ